MINITDEAAKIFKKEIIRVDNKSFKIRIAVMRKNNSDFNYAIGFDDNISKNDKIMNIKDIELVISEESLEISDGMVVDYVEIEKNKFNFIFLNPKDSNYVEPKE